MRGFARKLSRLALAVGLLGWSRVASAEVTLFEQNGWRFFADGRVNAFYSYGFGDGFPEPTPNPTGVPHTVIGISGGAGQSTPRQSDAENRYSTMRVRSGFVGTVFGMGLQREVVRGTTAKGFIGLWAIVESIGREKQTIGYVDAREGYVVLDGPWGSLTAGRTLGLFGRISTEIDFMYGHNFGLGYPCGDEAGPTCGHIGTGVMFPGFAAGFMYGTPSLAGVKLQVGLYDPVRLLGAWDRTNVLRPEAALSFETKLGTAGMLKLSAEGMYQPLSRVLTAVDANGTRVETNLSGEVWGASAGGRLEAGPVRFGASVFRGSGLGYYYALQNAPSVFDVTTRELRTFTGMYAQSALVLGKAQVSLGAGRVYLDQLESDRRDAGLSMAKGQTGVSAAFYYHVSPNLVLGLDYFRFMADWYGAPNSAPSPDPGSGPVLTGGVLAPEKQALNFLNAGATVHW